MDNNNSTEPVTPVADNSANPTDGGATQPDTKATAPAAPADNLLNTGNTGNTTLPEFGELLGESYKNDPSITKFKDVDSLAKSYKELESQFLQGDKIILPKEGDSNFDASMDSVFEKLGMPKDANDYSIEQADLSEFGLEAGEVSNFKNLAKEMRLTDSQAKGLYEWYIGDVKDGAVNQRQQASEQMEKASTELRKEFGASYDEKLNNASKVFEKFFPSLSTRQELGRDPAFIRDLVNISKSFSESTIGEINLGNNIPTPAQAEAELASIMSSEAYQSNMHPENKLAVDKANELRMLIMGVKG